MDMNKGMKKMLGGKKKPNFCYDKDRNKAESTGTSHKVHTIYRKVYRHTLYYSFVRGN